VTIERTLLADLRSTARYLIALLLLLGSSFVGFGFIAQRVADIVEPSLATLFDSDADKPPTRLQVAAENAREVRMALAKPMAKPPLPPITATLAHGRLKEGGSMAWKATDLGE
jgi:hypothetical protein